MAEKRKVKAAELLLGGAGRRFGRTGLAFGADGNRLHKKLCPQRGTDVTVAGTVVIDILTAQTPL